MILELKKKLNKVNTSLEKNSELISQLQSVYEGLKSDPTSTRLEQESLINLRVLLNHASIEQKGLKQQRTDLDRKIGELTEGITSLESVDNVVEIPDLKTNNDNGVGHGKRAMLKRSLMYDSMVDFVLNELRVINELKEIASHKDEPLERKYLKKVAYRQKVYLSSYLKQKNLL